MRKFAATSTLLLIGLIGGCSEYEVQDFGYVDVFNQNPAEDVDILLVVDNSCSMQTYQTRLGQNFSQFISWFVGANINYQIAVTTTSLTQPNPNCTSAEHARIPAPGQFVDNTVITPSTPDAASVFNTLVNVGTCGSANEMGLEAARLALSEPNLSGANAGFLRPEASLSLIFVSDEEDYSPLPVNEYINGFFDVKGQRDRHIFNASALAIDSDACVSFIERGSRYIDVAQQTSGVLGDLCSDDFESIVTELSLNASRLRDAFFLSSDPDPNNLHVFVEDTEIDCGTGIWWLEYRLDAAGEERTAVVFDWQNLPQPNERVSVRYEEGTWDPATFCTGGAQ
ncbi:MAG: hypothetical protein EP330_27270 [Deltaproteobacteria bacterium]|nr:MAG: hypothetical protein EP330_27270 [Deltaproteobacteria bacterium]